jgi:hypothetical protein
VHPGGRRPAGTGGLSLDRLLANWVGPQNDRQAMA